MISVYNSSRLISIFILLFLFQSCCGGRYETKYDKLKRTIRYELRNAFSKNKNINSSCRPSFNLKKDFNSDKTFDLNLEYGFEIFKKNSRGGATGSMSNFTNGEYLIESSPAANELLNQLKRTLLTYFRNELRTSRKIHFELYGYSDASKFSKHSNKSYRGEFGIFPSENKSARYMFFNENKTKPIELRKGDKLNNENLGFLRAYGIEKYIREEILVDSLSWRPHNFRIFVKEEESAIGPEFRKIKIDICLTKLSLEN